MSQWITSCLTEGWQWEASEIALLGSTHLRGPFPQCSLYRSWEHSISDLYNIRPTASCGPREFLLQHVRAFSIAHGSPKALLRIINCLSNIGVGSGEFGCEGFLSVIPKLAQKVIVRLLPTNFLLQISWRSFLVWPRKKGLRVFFCFLQTLGAIFARIFRVLPRFSTNQNFSGCAFTTCTPRLLHHCFPAFLPNYVEMTLASRSKFMLINVALRAFWVV